MKPRSETEAAEAKVSAPSHLWIFVYLTAVFLVNHDWYLSQTFSTHWTISADTLGTVLDEGTPLRRFVFLSLGVFAAAGQLSRRQARPVKSDSLLSGLIVLFVIWTAVSVTWSSSPSSFKRVVVFTMLWLGAFGAAQRFALRDIALWVYLSTVFYLNLGIVAEVVLGTFQPLASGYRFSGTLPPNSQAVNCAVALFASILLFSSEKRRRWLFAATACEALLFLFLTKSRTSLGSAIAALLIIGLVRSPLPRKVVLVLSGVSLACLLALFADYTAPSVGQVVTLGREDSHNSTLTGRTPIWTQAAPYIAARPLQGYGYGGFWTPRRLVDFAAQQGWTVPDAHSSYLDLVLGVGVVGAGAFVLIMIVGLTRTLVYDRDSSHGGYAFLAVVLLFVLLASLTESIAPFANHVSFVTMLVLVRLAIQRPLSQVAAPRIRSLPRIPLARARGIRPDLVRESAPTASPEILDTPPRTCPPVA